MLRLYTRENMKMQKKMRKKYKNYIKNFYKKNKDCTKFLIYIILKARW